MSDGFSKIIVNCEENSSKVLAKCVGNDWSASRDSSYACWRDREHAYWSLRRKTGTAPAVNISTIIVIFTIIFISNNELTLTLNIWRSTGTQHHRWKNARTARTRPCYFSGLLFFSPCYSSGLLCYFFCQWTRKNCSFYTFYCENLHKMDEWTPCQL